MADNKSNDKKTSGSTIKSIASRVLEACPRELVSACIRLAETVETAVRLNLPIDLGQFRATEIRNFFCSPE
jgi:hypothetical protein